jgi:hypothetical protein
VICRPWLNQDFRYADFEADCREMLAGSWNANNARRDIEEDTYRSELYALREFVLGAMDHFQRDGEWSFEQYRAFIRLAPPLFSGEMLGQISAERIGKRFVGATWLIDYARRLAWETLLAATEGKADESFLYALAGQPEGARWLLQCARLIEARGLGPKEFNDDNYDDLSRALKSFCDLEALSADGRSGAGSSPSCALSSRTPSGICCSSPARPSHCCSRLSKSRRCCHCTTG